MILMVLRFAVSIQYLNVIIFLSPRERSCPIQFRQWCRNHIGVFPFGLYPHGVPCFVFGFFGLQHHRDHGHDFPFSKLRKDLQSQIWDPGDSNSKTDMGGLRSLTSHIYGSLLLFGSEIGLSVSHRSATLLLLCIDVGILFHLMFISFGIGVLLLKFKTRDFNLRFEEAITHPQSDELVAPVHDYVGCDYFSLVMELWLHQFGFCWSAMSIHMGWVKFWQQGFVCVVDIWKLKNALVTFRWDSYDMRRSDFWDAMVNLFVVMLEKWYDQVIQLWLDLIVFVTLQPLLCYYAHSKEVQICWLRKASVMYRWELIDTSELETWIGTVVHDSPMAFGVKTFIDVYGFKCTIGRAYPGATSLFYVMWSFTARMPERHTYHVRVRWILKEEYIMFYNMIASKAYRKEASSISLFQLCPLQHMAHKSAYVKVCFCKVLYGLNTVVIFII